MSIIIMSDTPSYDEVKNLSIPELITVAKHKRSRTFPFRKFLLDYVCTVYGIRVPKSQKEGKTYDEPKIPTTG